MTFLAKLSRFWRRWGRLATIVLVPCLLALVFLIEEPNNHCRSKDADGNCNGKTVLAPYIYVLLWMAFYWVSGVVSLSSTALLPMILFPLLGIMPASKVAPTYMKDISMLFLGGLIFACAIQKTNLHRRIALRILLTVGTSPHGLMAGLQICTWFLSMWISNTATTVMMMPIAEAIFVVLEKQEERRFYQSNSQVKSYKNSKALRTLFVGLTLAIPHSANIGGMATVTGTPPNKILVAHLETQYPCMKPEVDFGLWMGYAFPNSVIYMTLAYIWLSSYYIGCPSWVPGCGAVSAAFRRFKRAVCFWKSEADWEDDQQAAIKPRSEDEEKELRQVIQKEYDDLGPMSKNLGEMIVSFLFVVLILLWFFRAPKFGGFSEWFKPKYVSDSTVALLISGLLFILPLTWPDTKSDKPTAPILTWEDAEKNIPWSVIMLIGGGYALNAGSTESGFSEVIKNGLVGLKGTDPWLIVFIINLLIGTATEFTSNTATETLFVTIISDLAVAIEVNPLFLLVPMTLATSLAFMLPVATPPNAIAFAYNRITIADMATSGFVMNIVGFSLETLLINALGRAVFDIDPAVFPAWASDRGFCCNGGTASLVAGGSCAFNSTLLG